MTGLDGVAYAADAAILGSYAYLTRTGKAWWFHAANAVGFVPLMLIEVLAHAWPVLPITVTFGLLGAYGVVRGES